MTAARRAAAGRGRVGLGWAALGAGGTGLLLGAGGRWWVLDLAAHVRLQEAALLGSSTVLLAAGGRRRAALAAGLAFGCAVATVAPLSLHRPAAAAPGAVPLRIASWNVESGNAASGTPASRVMGLAADLVVLQEAAALVTLLRARQGPLRVVHPGPGSSGDGIVVLSRVGGTVAVPLDLGGGRTSVEVRVPHDGGEVAVLAVHPLPPVRPTWAAAQRGLAAAAAGWAAARRGPRIVVGDLNATPWSAAFSTLTGGDLRTAQRGFGPSPTWAPRSVAWPMLPIDHVLHSPELTTLARATGPRAGSDHRLLVVTIARAAAPA